MSTAAGLRLPRIMYYGYRSAAVLPQCHSAGTSPHLTKQHIACRPDDGLVNQAWRSPYTWPPEGVGPSCHPQTISLAAILRLAALRKTGSARSSLHRRVIPSFEACPGLQRCMSKAFHLQDASSQDRAEHRHWDPQKHSGLEAEGAKIPRHNVSSRGNDWPCSGWDSWAGPSCKHSSH